MKFQTNGLIIKEQSYGENDKLVWALTASHGVLRAFAKGAKSIRSAKCAPTSLLSYSRLTFYKSRETYIIGDAASLRIFSKLRADVKKMCLAQYFCELALTICPQEQPAEPFLSLLLNSLYLLSQGTRSENLIKPCLEIYVFPAAHGNAVMRKLRRHRRCGAPRRSRSQGAAAHGLCGRRKAVFVQALGRGLGAAQPRVGGVSALPI